MNDLQESFDFLVHLLEKSSQKNKIITDCLDSLEGEVAFTPANTKQPASRNVLLRIYILNAGQDNKNMAFADGYDDLLKALETTSHELISMWGIDTDRGCFTIFTNTACTEFIGIIKLSKTLTDIRRQYFLQKEALEKIGEKPVFDYEQQEKTFINRKFTG